ncbi:unnamed protein product, partial [Mesorhabditis belari]|uniref:Uncharacterized protein n=1 Tax=Mesorhabditis belari TaxID=2138241 RepID=A0AAF3FLL4_9BILA
MSGMEAMKAVPAAAEGVKDKFKEMPGNGQEDRSHEKSQSTWEQTDYKKEQAKDFASKQSHKSARKIDEH